MEVATTSARVIHSAVAVAVAATPQQLVYLSHAIELVVIIMPLIAGIYYVEIPSRCCYNPERIALLPPSNQI